MSLEKYPTLVPIPGLLLEAYVSRADTGSGIKFFIVYKVGRKYVHLFYSPQLMSIRITRKEFNAWYMQPLVSFEGARFKHNLNAIINRDQRLGHRFSAVLLNTICNLEFTCGSELFAAAKVPHISKPVRNVKRG